MLQLFAVSVISERDERAEHELHVIEAASADHAEAHILARLFATGARLIGLLHMPAKTPA